MRSKTAAAIVRTCLWSGPLNSRPEIGRAPALSRTSNSFAVYWQNVVAASQQSAAFPETPLWGQRHSIGGLRLGWHEAMGRVERSIILDAGLTHVSDHPTQSRRQARLFWSPPVRGLAQVTGDLPGRLLGLGADLPLGGLSRLAALVPATGLVSVGRRAQPAPAGPRSGCRAKRA